MTDEYTHPDQPDCPAPSDETYRRDEATPKGWPNELQAALLALAVLFLGMWGYKQLLRPFGSLTSWVLLLFSILPIVLLLVLFLLMQWRFRFDLLGRFKLWPIVLGVGGTLILLAFHVNHLSRHGSGDIGMFWIVLWGGVTVPIVEELFFRGVLLKALTRHVNSGWAIMISTLAFAFAHAAFLHAPFAQMPFTAELFYKTLISMVLLGSLLGVLTVRTRSIVPATVGHIVWNILSMFGLPMLTMMRF